jgi:uncharacterized protein involved in exopolysaccharide biosynthesis
MTPGHPVPVEDGSIDVIAVVRLLWRHRVLIAVTSIAFGAAAVAEALLAIPIYRAETTVMTVTDTGAGGAASTLAGRFGGLASLAGIDLGGGGPATQEAIAVLESRNLVEEYLRRNKLADVVLPAGGETSGLWFAVKKFRETILSISTDDMARTTIVAIEWKDPAVAAEWANGIVALTNELMRSRAMANSKRNIEYLQKQIAGTDVVEMQRVMYGLVENETKTLMFANARPDYALRVIDPAVAAESRIRPKRKLIVATGIALGLFLACLFVIIRDLVRRNLAREATEGAARGP